jgi:hypothetical protein
MGNPLHGHSDLERWLEELAACRLDPLLLILQTVRRPGWHVDAATDQGRKAWAHRLEAWGGATALGRGPSSV